MKLPAALLFIQSGEIKTFYFYFFFKKNLLINCIRLSLPSAIRKKRIVLKKIASLFKILNNKFGWLVKVLYFCNPKQKGTVLKAINYLTQLKIF